MSYKYLLIVESPAKAKTINKYLGNDYLVLSSFGHMFDLGKTEKCPWGIDFQNNYQPIYSLMDDKKKQMAAILEAAEKAEAIIIASDPDREGEAIAWHIAKALKKCKKPMKRAEFHEITKASITKALAKTRDIDEKKFNAQQARRVIDRIVGYSVSTYLNKQKISETSVSAGRVQSVALKLIGDRENEIVNFKPDTYYVVTGMIEKNGIEFEIKNYNKIIDDKISKTILADLKNGVILSELEKISKPKYAPPPFETSSLMGTAASELGYATTQTMQLAQSLYEKGLITYMRTDSLRSSPESIEQAREYLSKNQFKLPTKANSFAAQGNAQDAHEAIRPTNCFTKPEELTVTNQEQILYNLIWRRFLASQMLPALFDNTTASFITNNKVLFKAYGRVLKDKGWLAIQPDFDDKSKDVSLPDLEGSNKNNEKFIPKKCKSQEKQTKPPSRFSSKTLIEELKKKGIGRPSTYATIVSKIIDRKYVDLKKEIFYPTDLGFKVLNKIDKNFTFMNYDYTANLESILDQIEEGKKEYTNTVHDVYSILQQEIYKLNGKTDKICKKCSSPLKKIVNSKQEFYYCLKFPECSYKETTYQKTQTCPNCTGYMIIREGQYGTFWGCTRYPDCKTTKKEKIND